VFAFELIIVSCFQGEVLDDSALKRLILLFEKRALRNQEMRIKFPDMPEKYVYLP
jgi:beta-catenin-like protein 1